MKVFAKWINSKTSRFNTQSQPQQSTQPNCHPHDKVVLFFLYLALVVPLSVALLPLHTKISRPVSNRKTNLPQWEERRKWEGCYGNTEYMERRVCVYATHIQNILLGGQWNIFPCACGMCMQQIMCDAEVSEWVSLTVGQEMNLLVAQIPDGYSSCHKSCITC